jgi:hypothetical protein
MGSRSVCLRKNRSAIGIIEFKGVGYRLTAALCYRLRDLPPISDIQGKLE